MGCGFSAEEKASDEERILSPAAAGAAAAAAGGAPTNPGVGCAGKANMGTSLTKNGKKSPSKKSKSNTGISRAEKSFTSKVNSGNSSPSTDSNGKLHSTNGRGSSVPSSAIQSSANEVSTSQVNFFKMLDEKIENGVELEEQDSESERLLRLQRVAEEWDNLLGRSQDSKDDDEIGSSLLSSSAANIECNDDQASVAVPTALEFRNAADSSNDSMRTLFSNSVTLPSGTFREVVSNNNKSDSLTTAAAEAGGDCA